MRLVVINNKDESFAHGPQPEGFEHHGRLTTALDAVQSANVGGLELLAAPRISPQHLLLAHSERYIDELKRAVHASHKGGTPFHDEVLLYPGSLDAALTSAGGALKGVDMIASGTPAVFSVCRSPGHHAEPERAMGFCLLSNAGLAARYASKTYGMRTAMIDIDIHNGNGTFSVIENDPNCYFAEIYLKDHKTNSYPYGASYSALERTERSRRIGLADQTSGQSWLEAFSEGLIPSIRRFSPQLLIISAGFDCMKGDPVGGFHVTAEDIGVATKALCTALQVPVLSLLEGGYNLSNLAQGVSAHAREIAKLG